jgi:membrane associated rhomboid family serine protease
MASPVTDLLEIILRECAGARPGPWYPSDFARATGVPRDALDAGLDQLRLGGLVRLTDWVQGKGQGYALTVAGEKVLEKPRLVDRLRAGVVPRAETPRLREQEQRAPGWERARAVHDALISPSRPTATLGLIAANVLVFVVGLALAQQRGVLREYVDSPLGLGGGEVNPARALQVLQAERIRHSLGAMSREDVKGGAWWQLLTTCFVHIGLIHLLMNMYALWILGPLLEKMLGSGRYLLLYLASGIVGSCAALLFSPAPGAAGASGAICGLLGGMAAWVYLNRSYLGELSARMMRGIVINVILIVVISMIPGVSGASHFGGGVAGLLAAVPLTYSRFAESAAPRWLGLLGALLVPVVALGWLAYKLEPKTELEKAQARCGPPLIQVESVGNQVYKEYIDPLCTDAERGRTAGADQVQAALAGTEDALKRVREVADAVPSADSYQDGRLQAALGFAHDYVNGWVRLLEEFRTALAHRRGFNRDQAETLRQLKATVDRAHTQLGHSVLFGGR